MKPYEHEIFTNMYISKLCMGLLPMVNERIKIKDSRVLLDKFNERKLQIWKTHHKCWSHS